MLTLIYLTTGDDTSHDTSHDPSHDTSHVTLTPNDDKADRRSLSAP